MNLLYKAIATHFTLEELKQLCFGLGINFEELPQGDGSISSMSLALIEYILRHNPNNIKILIGTCQTERPNINWEQLEVTPQVFSNSGLVEQVVVVNEERSQYQQYENDFPTFESNFIAPSSISSVEKAVQHLQNKKYLIAIKKFESIVDESPELAEGYCYLALSNLKGKSFNMYARQLASFKENMELANELVLENEQDWLFPQLLLAVLEIDYYHNHGLHNDKTVVERTSKALQEHNLDKHDIEILKNQTISSKAKELLGLQKIIGS